jgi:tetratricopeptide (TPR) repeat protein
MLTPASVLTNKNCGSNRLIYLLLAAICLGLCSCSPPGPRALLQGKKLIEDGNYEQAVEKLETATALLPKNALAWNYLGLAYHGSQQPEAAIKAYRTALALDHKLVTVRYNLGCLFLEQDNLAAATDELKSYTLLQPGASEGWLKLGTAQLRARRLDEAEKSFRTAIELQVRNPEALNGLGLIQVQRRRWLDANGFFNVAAMQDPPYAPSVLNSAVMHHQYLNNRPMALQRYKQYLALQPRPADWDTVDATARQLEQELNPAPVARTAPPQPTTATSPALRTNVTLVQNPPSTRTTQGVLSPLQPLPAKTESSKAPTVSRTTASSTAIVTSQPVTAARSPVEPAKQPVRTPAVKAVEPPPVKPADIEVTQVQSDFVIKPAQDLSRSTSDTTTTDVASEPSPSSQKGGSNSPKRGLLSRLNPFSGKPKTEPSPSSIELSQPTSPGSDPARSTIPGYSYLSPAPPTPGSRLEGEKAFKRGVEAYKDGKRVLAVREYRAAVTSDPAYYDAYYNLGLAALENGDVRLSLWAYEIALSLKPDSVDSRYNFALALKAGGYHQDAKDQLQRIIATAPGDARAHLSAANLYAQQLRQPQLAREHYQRVLEINPRHPEASKIRFWLTANP